MPQRGWKLADTTVNLSAAIGRKLPAGDTKRLLGKSMPSETKEQRTAGEEGADNIPSMTKGKYACH